MFSPKTTHITHGSNGFMRLPQEALPLYSSVTTKDEVKVELPTYPRGRQCFGRLLAASLHYGVAKSQLSSEKDRIGCPSLGPAQVWGGSTWAPLVHVLSVSRQLFSLG